MTNLAYALILSAALASAYGPAAAQTAPPPSTQEQTPESLLRSGIENLLRALGLALQNLPQYEMPQVNEYGDIVIRRVNPARPRPVPPPSSEEPRRL
jgi:hypothetical protein